MFGGSCSAGETGDSLPRVLQPVINKIDAKSPAKISHVK
jgi:hypothetical protein